MTESGTGLVPRRVGPVVRGLVAVLIGIPPGSAFVAMLELGATENLLSILAGAGLLGMALGTMVALNYGYMPRLQGSVLEVTTLLGRQTVDLAALTAVGYQLTKAGRSPRLRLTDSANTVLVRPAAGGPGVLEAIRRGVWEAAGHRHVAVLPEVPGLLGLPPLPGMQDSSAGVAQQFAVFAGLSAAIGAVVGIGALVAQLAG